MRGALLSLLILGNKRVSRCKQNLLQTNRLQYAQVPANAGDSLHGFLEKAARETGSRKRTPAVRQRAFPPARGHKRPTAIAPTRRASQPEDCTSGRGRAWRGRAPRGRSSRGEPLGHWRRSRRRRVSAGSDARAAAAASAAAAESSSGPSTTMQPRAPANPRRGGGAAAAIPSGAPEKARIRASPRFATAPRRSNATAGENLGKEARPDGVAPSWACRGRAPGTSSASVAVRKTPPAPSPNRSSAWVASSIAAPRSSGSPLASNSAIAARAKAA